MMNNTPRTMIEQNRHRKRNTEKCLEKGRNILKKRKKGYKK